jgi:predicted ester cyclase
VSEANKSVVRRLVDEVMNRGRLDVLGELYRSPPMADAARAWITPFRIAFPDVHMRVVDLVAEGDKVAARFDCSATQHGPWQGRPATGQRFEQVAEVYFFRFRDGRIISAWGLEDNVERMRQLGHLDETSSG